MGDVFGLQRVGQYRVLLCDPPWRYQNWSRAGEGKGAARHYDCLTIDELKALRVSAGLDYVCAPDAACFMWATFPMLREAVDLMEAWGFAYKSGGAWGKTTSTGKIAFGTGYLYRSAAEIWLLGTRGNPKARSKSVRNLILAERREHSRKPDQMHADIERLFEGPYLELFARESRPGWDSWGNETTKFDAEAA